MSQADPATLAHAGATILCVDDEPNILSSLRRLFRPRGYKVLTADSGAEGLSVLGHEKVDLVISDMRMPGMDGAQFLEQVRKAWPNTMRLLLTGYSDIGSIMAAINRGEIYRYITKPWDDNDILLIVRHALERRELELLTERQNEELKHLNANLEAKVEARTREITKANEKLKANFITTIKILAGMIEMRGGNMAGHSRRVADLARRIATRMGVEAKEAQEIFIAGLLLDIGKIGFSDKLLAMPVSQMAGDNLHDFRKHPVRASQLLMPLEDLKSVATILHAQTERFDGQGFPDGAAKYDIPLGARILALAADYDSLQIGALTPKQCRPEDAKKLVYDSAEKRYDPLVVAAFRYLMDGDQPEPINDTTVLAGDLVPGMVLSVDLISREGLMLLPAERTIDEHTIQRLIEFENKADYRLTIRIWPRKETS